MQAFRARPSDVFGSVVTSWKLLVSLVGRELASRYKGSVLGILWSFLIPLFMLGIYTVVFSGIFKSRWSGTESDSKANFALIMFAGLIVFNFFSECINRAPGVIISNANLAKKVVFPLEILAWVAVASALFNSLVCLVVMVVAQAILNSFVPWTLIVFPLVLVPLIFFTVGAVWFLSSLTVFVRDVAQVTGLVTTGLLFLSAVFFPIGALPQEYRWFVRINPIALVVEWSRGVLVFGELPSLFEWSLVTVCGFIVAYLGFVWFQTSRKGFADVL